MLQQRWMLAGPTYHYSFDGDAVAQVDGTLQIQHGLLPDGRHGFRPVCAPRGLPGQEHGSREHESRLYACPGAGRESLAWR